MSLYDRIVESYPGVTYSARAGWETPPAETGPDALRGPVSPRATSAFIGSRWAARRRPERAPAKQVRSRSTEPGDWPARPRG